MITGTSRHRILIVLGIALSLPWWSAARGADEKPAEAAPAAWQKPYAGQDAAGPSVIGLWHFDAGAEKTDSSGHGHDITTLRGRTRFTANGKFAGALEGFACADGEANKPEGAVIKNHADLSPPGAFTLEMWMQLKPESAEAKQAILLDKKYYTYLRNEIAQANYDYCLLLNRAGTQWTMRALLGFSTDSLLCDSSPVTLETGAWHHLALTYDGAGTVRFFVDGQPAGKAAYPGRGAISPGPYDLFIGGRVGSTYEGFPGLIDEVRISKGVPAEFAGRLDVRMPAGRTAFFRMEKAQVALTVSNDSAMTMRQIQATVALPGYEKMLSLQDLAPDQQVAFAVPVDTTLRPDAYELRVAVTARAQGGAAQRAEKVIPIHIVPRRLPDRMPVLMWGNGDIEHLKAIGFTHDFISLADYQRIWDAGQPTSSINPGAQAEIYAHLDRYLVEGLNATCYTYPGQWLATDAGDPIKTKYQRIDRNGKPYANRPDVCGNFPEVRQYCYNVGASIIQTFGQFPAFQSCLVHSEVRDKTNLCFHEHDRAAFRAFAGYDIPDRVNSKDGISYSVLPGFPPDHLIADDDHLLTFYRWFWQEGDGWNELHTRLDRGLKSTGRTDFWTFFDPAVRVPSIWGSGGAVDVVSHWTYTYPDPIKIGQTTDELFAMAEGRPGQQVMKMTQIIWYRSQTAKALPKDESQRTDWEKKKPDAEFITIAPDHLREAFWSEISRPIRGIMYHGWSSLVDDGAHKSYRFTNGRTAEVLTELTHNVVQPLGPMLLHVPDRPADVALLESFAAQMFAGRGTRGWGNSWEADMHLVLQWAHLQPRIIYEQAVLRDGLDTYRVLVLPGCDVLPRSVAERIKQWQKRGGLVVADEFLAPGIVPDIVVSSYKRHAKPDEDKAALLARAAKLRGELDPLYQRGADSSDPDIVVRLRRSGEADYLFALNDRRTYGEYVGRHRQVMEDGVPLEGTLQLARQDGWVYDLVNHREQPARRSGKGLQFDAKFGPGDGRVYLVTAQKIAALRLEVPNQAKPGQQVTVLVQVVDEKNQPIKAVLPVQVQITDAQSRPAEFSGYYATQDGVLRLTLDIAPNDVAGTWKIRAVELASGRTLDKTIQVND